MNTPPTLVAVPPTKRRLLEELVDQRHQVPGVAAIVLGGSYASGTQHATSDIVLRNG